MDVTSLSNWPLTLHCSGWRARFSDSVHCVNRVYHLAQNVAVGRDRKPPYMLPNSRVWCYVGKDGVYLLNLCLISLGWCTVRRNNIILKTLRFIHAGDLVWLFVWHENYLRGHGCTVFFVTSTISTSFSHQGEHKKTEIEFTPFWLEIFDGKRMQALKTRDLPRWRKKRVVLWSCEINFNSQSIALLMTFKMRFLTQACLFYAPILRLLRKLVHCSFQERKISICSMW